VREREREKKKKKKKKKENFMLEKLHNSHLHHSFLVSLSLSPSLVLHLCFFNPLL
jgi:hypothetical protein